MLQPEFLRRELLLVYWAIEENCEGVWIGAIRNACLLKDNLSLLCISNAMKVT